MKCAACGSTAFVQGTLVSSDGHVTKFKPSGESRLSQLLGMGGRAVQAYGCSRCGHLQLAVEFSDEDRQRYQNFEGEQARSIVEGEGEEEA